MKKNMKITAAIFLLNIAFFNGYLNQAYAENIRQDTDREVRAYEVFGMDCPGCASALNKIAGRVSGVEKAVTDWQKGILTIHIKENHQVNDQEIFNAIKKANFTPGRRLK